MNSAMPWRGFAKAILVGVALFGVLLTSTSAARAEYYRECSYRFEAFADGESLGFSSYTVTGGGYSSGTGKARGRARAAVWNCLVNKDCQHIGDSFLARYDSDPEYPTYAGYFDFLKEMYCGYFGGRANAPYVHLFEIYPSVVTNNSDIRTDCKLGRIFVARLERANCEF